VNIQGHWKTILAWVVVLVVVIIGARYVHLFPEPQVSYESITTSFTHNNLDGAVADADKILARDPNNERALLLKAISLAQKGSITFNEVQYGTQALDIANKVIAMDPSSDEAYRIIGYANEIMQKYDAAHAAYAKAISLNEKSALAIADDAHAFDLQGQSDLAEAGYRRALAIDPNDDLANTGLGRILVAQKKLDEASKYLQNALEHAATVRQKAEAAYSLGVIASMKHDTPATESFMRQATSLDPNYSMGFAGLGAVLYTKATATSTTQTQAQRAALVKESLTDLLHAITLNKSQSEAYLQMGLEFAALGKKSDALIMVKSGLKTVPSDITLSAPDKVYTTQLLQGLLDAVNKMK
jgi:tetratricopeptide (TPR) repeat protein